MALGLDDVRVGVWTAPSGLSGCTVVLPPEGTVGAVAVRGSSPGTREAISLGPSGKVTVCHGVVLSGGSAYGLAAADGVMRWLEAAGVGYPTQSALVPIVGAAIVLDQGVGDPSSRPGADAGWAACESADAGAVAEGSVGAGAGATVAKVGGIEHCWRGGQGVSIRRVGEVVVGVVVINNAVGEVVGEDGRPVAATRAPAGTPRFPEGSALQSGGDGGGDGGGREEAGGDDGGPTQNTVIGCIVTNATLGKLDTHRVADLGHSGIARAVRPAHTSFDGDALFCLATGRVVATVDLVASMAADAVADACRNGPLAAHGHHDVPGLADAG